MRIELLDKDCMPSYTHEHDACMDCRARVDVEWEVEGDVLVAYVPLGFKIAVPRGHAIKLYSRSGHGWKDNITLANSVGIIDHSFRGELQAKLIRVGVSTSSPESIKKGDRVCQMALEEMPHIYLDEIESLDSTNRGEGFGSSGLK